MLRDNAVAYSISPDGSSIAFGTHYNRFGNTEIWLMGSAGELARKIYDTSKEGSVWALQWSPDGKRILYVQQDETGSFLVSRDLNGGPITKVLPYSVADYLLDFRWLPDGRMVCAFADDNIWGAKLDDRTGKAIEEPRRLTNWLESGLGFEFADATGDGKRIALRKTKLTFKSYLADLGPSNSFLSNPRQFYTQGSSEEMVFWTEGGEALVFSSYINGSERYYKQHLNQAASPQPLTISFKGHFSSTASPDGKWILYLDFPEEGTQSYAVVPVNPMPVMRVPINGGPAQQVFIAKPKSSLSCAKSPLTVCAVAEQTDDHKQLVFTSFDPMKGRGSEIARFDIDLDAHELGVPFALSPDGTRIAILRTPADPIYILSLRGQATQEIRVKGWSDLKFVRWSTDGKGLFVANGHGAQGAALLHVDIQGNVTVLWSNLRIDILEPSPDGRHLVFGGYDEDSNIWTLENF